MVSAALALLETSTGALVSALRPTASLVAENLSLRQQLAVLRVGRRPRLHPIDRAFWVVLSRVRSRWVDVLAIVKPATVIGWHRPCWLLFPSALTRRAGSRGADSRVRGRLRYLPSVSGTRGTQLGPWLVTRGPPRNSRSARAVSCLMGGATAFYLPDAKPPTTASRTASIG